MVFDIPGELGGFRFLNCIQQQQPLSFIMNKAKCRTLNTILTKFCNELIRF